MAMQSKKKTTSDWPRNLHTLYAPRQLRTLLHRECLRADRHESDLCAAVFGIVDSAPRRLRRLARILLKRSRETDEIGWLSARELCGVLPETGEYGAYCYAEGVRKAAAEYQLEVTYTIYRHSRNDSTSGRGDENSRASRADFREGLVLSEKSDRRHLVAAINRGLACDGDSPVAPLQALLISPLPWWKRTTDIIGACIGLAVAAPIIAVAALTIRVSSSGPVVFKQLRSGLRGKHFTILKFRTMVPDAERLKATLRAQSEQDGPAFKLAVDPRTTFVGRILRATSLDELPQFWNVLKGTMSLVGPRPLPIDETDGCHRWHRRRLDVIPGLTCIWQVRGRSRVCFDDWMRMDMEYIRRRSFFYDLKLLLLTVPAVILRRGAH